MKTRFLPALVALLLAFAIPATASDTTNGLPTGNILQTVTVYDGLWDDAAAVGTLMPGTAVIVLAQFGDMLQVHARADRIVGWVPMSAVQYVQSPYIYPGIVISQNVSLRQSPSTGATRIASIPNGTVLDLLNEQNGWYYVAYHDGRSQYPLEGWVLVDYIVRDPSFVTTTQSTYVYAMPTRSSKKVGQLVSGTQLVVIGEYDDFWVVNLRSASGFIYKRDIDADWITGGNG